MQIGFFGHSTCSSEGPGTYLTTVAEHFNAAIVHKGVGQGSEERILFDLKKSNNLDIAVIFHSRPGSLFLPNCSADFDIRKINTLWEDEVQGDTAMATSAFNSPYGNVKNIFETLDKFINCLRYYKKYLYHPDLHLNRFQGALVLIDSYCESKIPATVHVIDAAYIPPWLTDFKSGIRSAEIEKLVITFRKQGQEYPCQLLPEGHQKIADILIKLIADQLENK
jgi:hypothetical protein